MGLPESCSLIYNDLALVELVKKVSFPFIISSSKPSSHFNLLHLKSHHHRLVTRAVQSLVTHTVVKLEFQPPVPSL